MICQDINAQIYYLDISLFESDNLVMISSVIKIKLEEVLKKKDKSLYALSRETGVAYNQLTKIKKNNVKSISFDVMEKLCLNLECTPNDLFAIEK